MFPRQVSPSTLLQYYVVLSAKQGMQDGFDLHYETMVLSSYSLEMTTTVGPLFVQNEDRFNIW